MWPWTDLYMIITPIWTFCYEEQFKYLGVMLTVNGRVLMFPSCRRSENFKEGFSQTNFSQRSSLYWKSCYYLGITMHLFWEKSWRKLIWGCGDLREFLHLPHDTPSNAFYAFFHVGGLVESCFSWMVIKLSLRRLFLNTERLKHLLMTPNDQWMITKGKIDAFFLNDLFSRCDGVCLRGFHLLINALVTAQIYYLGESSLL